MGVSLLYILSKGDDTRDGMIKKKKNKEKHGDDKIPRLF